MHATIFRKSNFDVVVITVGGIRRRAIGDIPLVTEVYSIHHLRTRVHQRVAGCDMPGIPTFRSRAGYGQLGNDLGSVSDWRGSF